jgi:hypothetical protein
MPRRSHPETSSIRSKVDSVRSKDVTLFGQKGNVTYEDIIELRIRQKDICYVCNEKVIYDARRYCCYQFSIDRIHNTVPHNRDNILLSCYYCNCRDHPKFTQRDKVCESGCHTEPKLVTSKEYMDIDYDSLKLSPNMDSSMKDFIRIYGESPYIALEDYFVADELDITYETNPFWGDSEDDPFDMFNEDNWDGEDMIGFRNT